ncbi:hypothetical protein YC2023_051505 [Brassica napus]
MERCRGRERQTVSWKLKESLCFSEESETMMKTLRDQGPSSSSKDETISGVMKSSSLTGYNANQGSEETAMWECAERTLLNPGSLDSPLNGTQIVYSNRSTAYITEWLKRQYRQEATGSQMRLHADI